MNKLTTASTIRAIAIMDAPSTGVKPANVSEKWVERHIEFCKKGKTFSYFPMKE